MAEDALTLDAIATVLREKRPMHVSQEQLDAAWDTCEDPNELLRFCAVAGRGSVAFSAVATIAYETAVRGLSHTGHPNTLPYRFLVGREHRVAVDVSLPRPTSPDHLVELGEQVVANQLHAMVKAHKLELCLVIRRHVARPTRAELLARVIDG